MAPDPATRPAASLAPEHDWLAASRVVRPALRPVGTHGSDGSELLLPRPGSVPGLPLVIEGPAGLPIVYIIPGHGFDVVVGIEHLLAWGVKPDRVHAAAMANLSAWSTGAAWVEEVNDRRRIVWSDWGEGMDAARILLAEVRSQLVRDLAPASRILIGVPERDLLIATGIEAGDDEFEAMFADYVADRHSGADEPIDGRIFELVDGELEEAVLIADA